MSTDRTGESSRRVSGPDAAGPPRPGSPPPPPTR
jgi:hypothetical protein